MSSSSSSLEEVISESSLNGHHNTGESKNQFHPLTHQVAGHVFGHNKNKLSILKAHDNGLILKPIQPPNGEREQRFYERLFFIDDSISLHPSEVEIKKYVPVYHGSININNTLYLRLEDLADGMARPVVIDVKIGRSKCDPEASPEKIAKRSLIYPYIEKAGFYIAGMRVFNKKDESFAHYGKKFFQKMNCDELTQSLGLFFRSSDATTTATTATTGHKNANNRTTLDIVLEQLKEIRKIFAKQTLYHFYSCSILIVYDAQNSSNSEYNGVRVKLIDFGRVFPANQKIDENFLYGVEQLILSLETLKNSSDCKLSNDDASLKIK